MVKLYDKDSYIFEFTGKVISCQEENGEYKILLDQTAFFPTAGGQECDTGILDGNPVIHVEIENNEVFHYIKTPVREGTTVTGIIDKEIRLRKMQHHSAEHIVSGLVHNVLGLENVGFHLGNEEVTMDYNGIIEEAELIKIEQLANKAVRDNLKIDCVYPDENTLKALNYRSKLELTENVRIVTIPGIDVCACCAPHVKYTGEIGIIKIKDMIHYKGGVRVHMICAEDALSDYQIKHKNVSGISNLLSARQYDVAESVERIMAELSAAKQKCTMLEKLLIAEKSANIKETCGNICIFEKDISVDSLRNLVNIVKTKCGGVCVGCLGDDKSGYTYIVGSNGFELSKVCKEINTALSGRGGGRGDMVSGKFMSTKEEIQNYFKELKLTKDSE